MVCILFHYNIVFLLYAIENSAKRKSSFELNFLVDFPLDVNN